MSGDGKKIEVIGLGASGAGEANAGPRGIRSPLVGAALASASAPSTAKPPPTAEKPDESPLSFLDNQGTFERENATMISAVMFDGGAQKRRSLLWVLLVLAVAGIGGVLWRKPEWRTIALYRLTHAREDLINLVRYKKKPTAQGGDVEEEGGRPRSFARPTGRGGKAGKGVASEGCQTLATMASGGGKLTVPQRTHLAECHMLIDDPSGAEDALKALRPQLARAGERQLNGMKANDTLADAFLILTQAYVRQGKPREADELLNGRCARWEQTNTCVAKLIIAADRKLVNGDGLGKLLGSRGRLDAKAQARLWLAGAVLAGDEGKGSTADQRFDLALQAAPRDALALRKQIFEAQAIDLYHRGEALKLKNLVDRGLAELGPLDAGAKVKLKVLSDLSSSAQKAKTVRNLLTREDVSWRARGDFDLIEILGPESIKTKNEDAYIALLHQTAERFADKYKSSNTVLKKLVLWEIRALLAQEHYEKVREKLASYEKTYGKDAMTKHLNGLTYMLQDKSQKYQVLAAQEFQEAIRLKPGTHQWETLVALGLALTRAGKAEQAGAVIKDLDRGVSAKGQKYWVDMLKSEYYLNRDQLVNALTILNAWARNEPAFITPRRLRLQVFQKMGKKAEAEQDQGEIDELNAATRYAGSREGISSPIGVMAYGNRPLD